MHTVAVIPVRYASTRLPGKALADIHGRPLIRHVHDRVVQARGLDRVLVATDDERIADVVRGFGGEVMLTSARHATGTDRLAEAAGRIEADVIVNVQGDEPMLDPGWIEAALAPLVADERWDMSTVATPIRDRAQLLAADVVKVVADDGGRALYFSRSPIPYVRDTPDPAAAAVERGLAWRHLGLYVQRRDVLLRFASLPPAPLEQAEGLEQLRALHHGLRLHVARVEAGQAQAVDTPEDLRRVRALLSGTAFAGAGDSVRGAAAPSPAPGGAT